jgi:DNA-binding IclR family transcriptional regulator
VQAVERALGILEALPCQGGQMTLTELAGRLGLVKSTVYRLLAVMERKGFVLQDQLTKRYELGYKIAQLAATPTGQSNVRWLAIDEMKRLHALTDETVTLSLLVGSERVYIDEMQSTQPIRRTVEIGKPIPLHSGSAGKAMLAFLPEEEVKASLGAGPLKAFTPATITRPERLWRDLRKVRRLGYAVARQERVLGSSGVAAPIRDKTGRPVAAIGISLPLARFTRVNASLFGSYVKEAAKNISLRLGWRPGAGAAWEQGQDARRRGSPA